MSVQVKKSINEEDEEMAEEMSLDNAIDKLGFGWFQIKLLFIAGFCWMCESVEMMLLSVLSPVLRCHWNLSDGILATLTTVVFLGMMVGSVVWGAASDKYGRRFGFLATTFLTFVFGFASAFSPNIYVLLALRCLVGFGVGGGHVAFTLFAEYLPRKQRALCLVLIEIFWTFGTIGEAGLAWYLLPLDKWRLLLIISSLPLLLLCLFFWAVPESIRFYQMKGRADEAYALLKKVAKDNRKPIPCRNLIMPAISKPASFSDLLTPYLRTTSILLWVIWFANAFIYYGIVLTSTQLVQQRAEGFCGGKLFPPFWNHISHSSGPQSCGLDSNGYKSIFITSVAEFPGIVVTILVIDYLGRKVTQGAEFLIVGVFSLVVTMCLSGPLQTVFLFIVRGLITGAFQASYVYTPEVYPTSVRSTGLGVCSTLARVGGMITPYVAQVLIEKSNYITLGLYSLVSFAACIASFCLPIETSGRDMPDTIEQAVNASAKNDEKTPLLELPS